MRVLITCMQCFQEDGHPSDKMSYVEYNDANVYRNICERGHDTLVVPQQQRFELLFEIAANAILDGYYREAVVSFTAATERFFEFSFRVLASHVTDSEFTKSRKSLGLSERQLGAFVGAWVIAFAETPETLPEKKVKFRNDVIHKGKFPTKQEAIDYGETVFSLLKSLISKLKKDRSKELQQVVLRDLVERSGGKQSSTVGMPTIISLVAPMPSTLSEGLAALPGKLGRRPLG